MAAAEAQRLMMKHGIEMAELIGGRRAAGVLADVDDNPIKGGSVPQFYVNNSGTSWLNGYFLGLGSSGPQASQADVVAWLAPASGLLTNLTIIGQAANINSTPLVPWAP